MTFFLSVFLLLCLAAAGAAVISVERRTRDDQARYEAFRRAFNGDDK